MAKVAIINTSGIGKSQNDVEIHKPDCRDIPKRIDRGDEPWIAEFDSVRAAYLEYNADFIEESGDTEGHWHLERMNCASYLPLD